MSKPIGALLLLAGLTFAAPVAASPPPPPPSFIDEMAKELVPTPTSASFDRYAAALANDLTVTLNSKTIAANKGDWLTIERASLGKVDRIVYGYSEGHDTILVFDRFDDLSDEHCPQGDTCVFDPRYHSRAVQYQFGPDHLVHTIRILESDSFLITH